MLKKIIPLVGILAIAPFVNAQDVAPSTVQATTEKAPEITPEKKQLFLQALGWIIAKQSGIEALGVQSDEVEDLAKGFALALRGEGNDFAEKIGKLESEYAAFIQTKQAAAQKKAQEKIAELAKANKEAGAAYMKNCKKDKAFQELKSGILMKVEKAGDNKNKPLPENHISVRYTGKLIDGKIFDSSERTEKGEPVQFTGKSEPVTFPLKNLIPGWVEALQLVGKGAKITIVIPSELAYGDQGTAGIIQPGSTLVFDLELVDVQDAPKEELIPEAPEE